MVLEDGPWTFDNHLLLCRLIVMGEQLTQVEIFEKAFGCRSMISPSISCLRESVQGHRELH